MHYKIFAFFLRVSPLATSARNSLFLLFPSSAALGRAGLEAHGRAGLRRCRAALTLTGLGALEDRKCSFSYAI